MKRIDCIAEMVESVDVFADIGTDHAYLPIHLVCSGRVKHAYACDITEGPLSVAQSHIDREGLSNQITTILSNGFENVPNDVESVVIAGMGCHTAISILENAGDRLADLKQIIVQPNNEIEEFRTWISEHHYTIDAEQVVYDRGHDYVVISFSCKNHPFYTKEELVLGPCLMKEKSVSFRQYCRRQKEKLDFILSRRGEDDIEYEELKKKRNLFDSYCEDTKKEDQ